MDTIGKTDGSLPVGRRFRVDVMKGVPHEPVPDQLQAFVAAAESGSFSGAARKLGKAQSVISAAVANLEIDLGNALFDRTARYPVLTPAGERLLVEARVILERCEHFRGVAMSLGEGVESRLDAGRGRAVPRGSAWRAAGRVLATLSRRGSWSCCSR